MREAVVAEAQRGERADRLRWHGACLDHRAGPLEQQARCSEFAAEQLGEVTFALLRLARAVQLGERVREEVPKVPAREAMPARALPVEHPKALAADNDVPAAEVVVLQHSAHLAEAGDEVLRRPGPSPG